MSANLLDTARSKSFSGCVSATIVSNVVVFSDGFNQMTSEICISGDDALIHEGSLVQHGHGMSSPITGGCIW